MRTVGIIICIIIILGAFLQSACDRTVRTNMEMQRPIPAGVFLNQWDSRIPDGSGCYVILTDPWYENGRLQGWAGVYVGQSVHMLRRVRNHLTGHGNGDVYADVREGRDVQVMLNPCPAERMNDLEKTLIRAYHATDSYNRTRGGGIRR